MNKRALVHLELPADPKYILPLRLFLAGIAVRMNFSVDAIEDIKMAVSEVCTILLDDSCGGTFACEVDEQENLTFAIRVVGGKPGDGDDGISKIILEAIADACKFEMEDDRCVGIQVEFAL